MTIIELTPRQRDEADKKLVDEAGWIIAQLQSATFRYRMARGRLHTLYRDTPDFQERSARTRLVNASREIVKLRDRWNHHVTSNLEMWNIVRHVLTDMLPSDAQTRFDNAEMNQLTDIFVARLRANGYRITKRED